MKKVLSVILCLAVMCVAFALLAPSTFAEESQIADQGADNAIQESGAGSYDSIPSLRISRVYQASNDTNGFCHWCAVTTVMGYCLGNYTYDGSTSNYRTIGKDYSFVDKEDALTKYIRKNYSGYADGGCGNYIVPLTREASESGIGNNTTTYQKLYNQLLLGRPISIYTGSHACVVIGYKANNNKTLDANCFVAMEVKKQSNGWWNNSAALYNKYANNPQIDSNTGSEMSCYVTLKSWLNYQSNKTISTICYPTNYKDTVVKPSNPWIKASKTSVPTGVGITFTFGATNATSYTIGIDKNGARKITESVTSGKSYTFSEEGDYTAYVTCRNSAGYVDSSKVSFSVFKPIYLGYEFTAVITNSKGGLNLSIDSNNNVVLDTKSDSDAQKWHFLWQADNSTYEITNLENNKCLDVNGASTEPKTNIQVWTDNDKNSQRFYIRYNGYGYSLIPLLNTDLAVDIYDGALVSGTNIWDYKYNGSIAQRFSIDYLGMEPAVTQEYNGHIYEYYSLSMPWNQAYRFCQSKGGHLVTISDQAENDFVNSMINKHIWLGGVNFQGDYGWRWIDGSPLTYTNWKQGQPDFSSSNEIYIELYFDADGQWNDYPSNSSLALVCEYDYADIDPDDYMCTHVADYGHVVYEFYSDRVDWQTAEAICEAKGGHLLRIDSQEENDAVYDALADKETEEYWIDATDSFSEGTWTDHNGAPLTYTNWSGSEPSNDMNIEQYALISKYSGQWMDLKGYAHVYHNLGFICEYNKTDGLINGYFYIDGVLAKGAGLVEYEDAIYFVKNDGSVFTSGKLIVKEAKTNGLAEPGTYRFDADGKMIVNVKNGVVNGYYYENDVIVPGKGIVKFNDHFYFVRSDGSVYTNGKLNITTARSNGLVEPGIYRFDAEGKMIIEAKNGVVNGYYYENDVIVKGKGIVRFNDYFYFVRSDGSVYTNGKLNITTARANGLVEPGIYRFDAEGKMIIEAKNGVINGYYYENDVIVKGKGVVRFNDYFYFVRSDGSVYTNGNLNITTTKANGLVEPGIYRFDAEGKMIIEAKNGVIKGYYYENDVIVKGKGVVRFNDYFYFVRSDGSVYTNGNLNITTTKANGLVEPGIYSFDADGKMIISTQVA